MNNQHDCRAIAFVCIDFRLHPETEMYIKNTYGDFDLCTTAGSIKNFTAEDTRALMLQQINISCALHHPSNIILTMHQDCGAYGGTSAFGSKLKEEKHHKNKLNEVANIIHQDYPQLTVVKYIMNLEPHKRGWKIVPQLLT